MVARYRIKRLVQILFGIWLFLMLYSLGLPMLWVLAEKPLPSVMQKVFTAGLWLVVAGPGYMAFSALALAAYMLIAQRRFQRNLASEGQTVLVLPRPDAPPARPDRTTLWQRLVDVIPVGEHIAFELSGDQLSVVFSVRASEKALRPVITQIMAEWPGTRVVPVEQPEDDPLYPGPGGKACWWVEVGPSDPYSPITTSVPTPLTAILTELARLPKGVRGGVQVLTRADPFTRRRLGREAAKRAMGKNAEEKRTGKEMDERAQSLFLEARVLVWASASELNMARSVARSLARTLIAQFGPSNPLRIGAEGPGCEPYWRKFPCFTGMPWADRELSAFAYLPGRDGIEAAGQLQTAPAKPLSPSPASRVPPYAKTIFNPWGKEPWVVLGEYVDDWGERVQVGFPLRDLRTHASVLGTTGTGKSTLERNLALQGFFLGSTVVVMEPHGDLCIDPEEGIVNSLPWDAMARLVVADLASDWPFQINLAAVGLGAGRSVAVQTAMRCIRVVEEASWSVAVRMREILEHALHLLLDVLGEAACMVALHLFLADPEYRRAILDRASEGVGESKEYWQRLTAKLEGKGDRDESLDVALRRVGKFLRDERFRRSLALPVLGRELRISDLLESDVPLMILVPLQADKLGDEIKRVFGTLFMQLVVNAFFARSAQEAAQRRQSLVLIDEFADLAPGEVGELVNTLLAQARKFGASVILATQFIHQLPREVKQEVKSNTNVKIMLRAGGDEDAREAVRSFGSDLLTEKDVLRVERFHAYARVMVHGEPQPPFYYASLPPLHLPSDGRMDYTYDESPQFPELEKLHRVAKEDPEQAIALLVGMKDDDFRALAGQQVSWGECKAAAILAEPEPLDPRERLEKAMRISRHLYGMPWWFLEAYYRRLRFGG